MDTCGSDGNRDGGGLLQEGRVLDGCRCFGRWCAGDVSAEFTLSFLLRDFIQVPNVTSCTALLRLVELKKRSSTRSALIGVENQTGKTGRGGVGLRP